VRNTLLHHLKHQRKLFVYIYRSSVYCLKSINIKTKSVKTIARLAKGIIDGIEADGKGNYFVSQTDGRIYQISKSGSIRKILDMTTFPLYTANFTYCRDRHLLVIPTFTENSVIAFSPGR